MIEGNETTEGGGTIADENNVERRKSMNLYLPSRISKPENWQFIKLVGPAGEKREWKTNECLGAYCEKCKMHLKYDPEKGNTKQVQNHMTNFHAKQLSLYVKSKTAGTKRTLVGMEKFVTKKHKSEEMLPASKADQAVGDALLSLWVAKSLRPFSIVEDEGLIQFIEYANVSKRKLTIPSRKTVRKNIMKIAKVVSKEMSKAIHDSVDYFALTTDIWSSLTMQSFMAITLHALTEAFEMIDFTLEVKPLALRHTGENIKDYFQEIFVSRGLKKEKMVMMLRDNASNGIKACELFDIRSFGCIGHGFHLITGPFLLRKKKKGIEEDDDDDDDDVDDNQELDGIYEASDVTTKKTMDEVVSTVAAIRQIAKYIKKSTIAKEYFDQLQRAKGLQPVALQLDVQTRWNSALVMLRKALRLKDEVCTFLHHLTTSSGKKDFNRVKLPGISEEKWCLIHGLCILLEPFNTATTKLSGEKYPTFVFALPVLRLLKKLLMNANMFALNTDDDATDDTKDLKVFKENYGAEDFYDNVTTKLDIVRHALLHEFKNRFRGMDHSVLWTTALDPRFRSMKHLTADEQELAKSELYEQVSIQELAQLEEKASNTNLVARDAETSSDGDWISSMFDSPPKATNDDGNVRLIDAYAVRLKVEREIEAYLSTSNFVSSSCNPLEWWKQNMHRYPAVSRIARKWLCVPATSTPSERVFSDCGLAGAAKRSNLNAEALQNQVIIRRNVDALGLKVEDVIKIINSQ